MTMTKIYIYFSLLIISSVVQAFGSSAPEPKNVKPPFKKGEVIGCKRALPFIDSPLAWTINGKEYLKSKSINALEAGIKIDPVLNQTKEINALIAKVGKDPAIDSIYFPKGIYYIAGKMKLRPGVNIIGAGQGKTVFEKRDAKSYLAVGGGADFKNAVVSLLTINNTSRTLLMVKVANLNFYHVEFKGGIVRFEDSKNLTFEGNIFNENLGKSGYASSKCVNVRIVNNTFNSVEKGSINLSGHQDSYVAYNYITSPKLIDSGYAGIRLPNTAQNNIVEHNYIHNHGRGIFVLSYSSGNTVRYNLIDGTTYTGLFVQSPKNVFRGNVVKDAGTQAIYVVNGSRHRGVLSEAVANELTDNITYDSKEHKNEHNIGLKIARANNLASNNIVSVRYGRTFKSVHAGSKDIDNKKVVAEPNVHLPVTTPQPVMKFHFGQVGKQGDHTEVNQDHAMSGATVQSSKAEKKTNIIFIMADDLGYGDLGCYGQKLIKTPHIDKLAKEGVRFTQCYAGSTVCAPSRSVLMTGKHTGHTTVRGNNGRHGRVPLNADDVTVAEVLKQAGYTTGMTGKWGLGEPDTSGLPSRQGFDQWFGYLNQARAHTYYPSYVWENEKKVKLDGNKESPKTDYTHDMCTDFALKFIRDNQKKPFFLYVPYCIPHSKLEIPSIEPYANEQWSTNEKKYAAMVTRMDRDVGRMMALLKELKIDDDTIIFFCSDNGAASRWEKRFNSSGSLRGKKRDLYDGGLRTPMVVRWPGRIKPNTESDLVWYFPDVLPTCADIAGTEAPEGLDGSSILPTLLGKSQDMGDRFLYWEFFEKGYQQAVRWRDWKAIRLAPNQKLELYDLSKDIGEKSNVATEHPEVIASIETYLKTARSKSEEWPITKSSK